MTQYNFDQYFERRDTDSLKWSAYPQDVIPMWVADSDFCAPQKIIEALNARTAHPAFGYANFYERMDNAARHWLSTRFDWQAPQGSSAFAPGVVASVSLVISTFTSPGDNIVTLSPSYPPLIHKALQNKRNSLASPMTRDENGHYSINFADLEKKLARPQSSLFILCNPHNPTGRAFKREELLRIGELCLKHKVLILSDEIHCDYVHTGKHTVLPSLTPELAESSIICINPSKTFNIAGLHTAAIISANPELVARYKSSAEAAGLHPNTLGALAFEAAYLHCSNYADAVREYVRGNLQFAVDYIKNNIPLLQAAMPEATYLLWINCQKLGLKQDVLMDFFLTKAKVALSSGENYNAQGGNEGEGFVRMNLACPRSTVQKAMESIAKSLG